MDIFFTILSGVISFVGRAIIDKLRDVYKERKAIKTNLEYISMEADTFADFIMLRNNNSGQVAVKTETKHPLEALMERRDHLELNIPIKNYPYVSTLKKNPIQDIIKYSYDPLTNNSAVAVTLPQHMKMVESQEYTTLLDKNLVQYIPIIIPNTKIVTDKCIQGTRINEDSISLDIVYEGQEPEKIDVPRTNLQVNLPEDSGNKTIQTNTPNPLDVPFIKRVFFCYYCGFKFPNPVSYCSNCHHQLE